MGVFSNKITRDELKPGDHIYSWRNAYLYSHHGIYGSEGEVIHFTRGPDQEVGTGTILDRVMFSSSASSDKSRAPCALCGDHSDLSGVISSCLDCFLWGGELYRFEYDVSTPFFLAKLRGGTCTLAPSDPPEDILRRASFLLLNGFGGYNIFKNNCEDFAIYCKTGLLVFTDISVGRSGQMTSIVAALGALVPFPLRFLSTSFSSLAVVNCGMYCVSRYISDIGVRRDVMKIPVERLVNPCDLGQVAQIATPEKLPCDLDHLAEPAIFEKVPGEKPLVSCELSKPDEGGDVLWVNPCDLGQVAKIATPEKLPCDLDHLAEPVIFEKVPGEKPLVSCELSKPDEGGDVLWVNPCDLGQVAQIATPEKLPCDLDYLAEPAIFEKVPGEKPLVSCELSKPDEGGDGKED